MARSAIVGIPYNPTKEPDPVGTVQAFEALDARVIANSAGAIIRNSLSALNATVTPAAGLMAWIIGDATVANNGVYENTGSSGSPVWTRRADLPYGFINTINVGAGTNDAVAVTSAIPIPSAASAALIAVTFLGANAGAMTLAVNDETARNLVLNGGGAIPADYVNENVSALVTLNSDGNYQFFSFGDPEAAQAGAENALASTILVQGYAEEWANKAEDSLVSAAAGGDGSTEYSAKHWAAKAAASAGAAGGAKPYATIAAIKALAAPSAGDAVILTAANKGGVFVFRSGDYSSQVAADTEGGIYLKADDTAATSGAWVREIDGPVHAQWFTTLPIAIAAASAYGANHLWLGEKGVTWTLSAGVTIPDDMIVFGNLVSGYGAKIDASSGAYTAVSLGERSALIGVEVEGSGSAAYAELSYGVVQYGTNNDPSAPTYVEGATIRNCYIHAFGNTLIEMRYTQNAKIEGCTLSGGGYAGIGLLSVTDADVHRTDISDIGPGSSGNAYGIFVSRLSGSYTVNPQSERVTVRNCTVTDMELWHAFDTHGGIDVTFDSCVSLRSPRAFILTYTGDVTNGYKAPQRCKVIGCKAFGMTTRASRDQGLWVIGAWNGSIYAEYAQNCVVQDCYFFQHGIDTSGSRASAAFFGGTRNLQVRNLNIDQASGHGVQFEIDNIDYSVDGLMITDCNSVNNSVIGILFTGNNNKGRICDLKILRNDTGLATYVTDTGIYSASSLSGFQLTLQNSRNLASTATSYGTSATSYDV